MVCVGLGRNLTRDLGGCDVCVAVGCGGEAFAFVRRAAELAETEAHHPDISFGWGYATVSLRTKKIKGLHENDFIMAVKLDLLAPSD